MTTDLATTMDVVRQASLVRVPCPNEGLGGLASALPCKVCGVPLEAEMHGTIPAAPELGVLVHGVLASEGEDCPEAHRLEKQVGSEWVALSYDDCFRCGQPQRGAPGRIGAKLGIEGLMVERGHLRNGVICELHPRLDGLPDGAVRGWIEELLTAGQIDYVYNASLTRCACELYIDNRPIVGTIYGPTRLAALLDAISSIAERVQLLEQRHG